MCLCTVYGSHRVHLFKNQKHLFLYHQGFLQKLETTKKKRSLFQLCTPRLRCSVSLQAAAFSPRLGSLSGPHLGKLYPGGSCSLDLHPWRSRQHIHNRSFLLIWLWGQGPSRDPTNQQKWGHTSSLVPSLKTFSGFALFQSRLRLASFNKTITIACVVCLCVCLFLKTCIYSTLDLNQATGVRSGEWNRVGGRVTGTEDESQMCPGFFFFGAAPALRAPPPSHTLACTLTCLVLEIRCSPFFF